MHATPPTAAAPQLCCQPSIYLFCVLGQFLWFHLIKKKSARSRSQRIIKNIHMHVCTPRPPGHPPPTHCPPGWLADCVGLPCWHPCIYLGSGGEPSVYTKKQRTKKNTHTQKQRKQCKEAAHRPPPTVAAEAKFQFRGYCIFSQPLCLNNTL